MKISLFLTFHKSSLIYFLYFGNLSLIKVEIMLIDLRSANFVSQLWKNCIVKILLSKEAGILSTSSKIITRFIINYKKKNCISKISCERKKKKHSKCFDDCEFMTKILLQANPPYFDSAELAAVLSIQHSVGNSP